MTGSSQVIERQVLPNKFIWLMAGIFILINLGYGIASGVIASSQLQQELTTQYTNLSSARATVLAQPVWQFETDRAQYILNTFMKDRTVLSARLFIKPEIYKAKGIKLPAGNAKTIITPIIFDDGAVKEKLGNVAITYSMDAVSELFYHKVLTSVIISLLLILIIALGIPRFSREVD